MRLWASYSTGKSKLQLLECKEIEDDDDVDDDNDDYGDDDDDDDQYWHLCGGDAGAGEAEDCEILRGRTDIHQVEGDHLRSNAVE